MLEKLTVSPRSVIEILGIYSLMLVFQASFFYLMGTSADWNLYFHQSSILLKAESYRALSAAMYMFMTIAIWLDAKIEHKIYTKSIILCIIQTILMTILHYMFFLQMNSALLFYSTVVVDLIILLNIFELSRKSYFASMMICPHLLWAIGLTVAAYQYW